MYLFKLICLSILLNSINCNYVKNVCLNTINEYNRHALIGGLQGGWTSFCEADVDEGVIEIFGEGEISKVPIHVVGKNETITYPVRDLCHIGQSPCFNKHRKTIVLALGWVTDGMYDIIRRSSEIAYCSTEYNVIIVDFATCITMLYNTVKHNTKSMAYILLKIVHVLQMNGQLPHDIYLAGFSKAAQIASLTAQMYYDERLGQSKLPKLILIDPAPSCDPKQNYINSNVASQVIVYHGNCGGYGIREAVGTLDFYPNGDQKYQNGCKSQVCSHMFPLWIFVESVCHPNSFIAVKCKDTSTFNKNGCDHNEATTINLDVSPSFSGCFFCSTGNESPYGLSHTGLKPLAHRDHMKNEQKKSNYEHEDHSQSHRNSYNPYRPHSHSRH